MMGIYDRTIDKFLPVVHRDLFQRITGYLFLFGSLLVWNRLPSGKLTVRYGKSPSLIGKSTKNGPFTLGIFLDCWFGSILPGGSHTHVLLFNVGMVV